MATSQEYIDFVCEQLSDFVTVRSRKMFGEYMVYADERPILLVCDNTVFVKKLDGLAELLADAPCGIPYEGSKEHYILDIENRPLVEQVIELLVKLTPLPAKRKKKS